jgi:hypothetical protein
MLIRLIPKVFYADIAVGLDLFVRCLGFEVLYEDASVWVLGRDGGSKQGRTEHGHGNRW